MFVAFGAKDRNNASHRAPVQRSIGWPIEVLCPACFCDEIIRRIIVPTIIRRRLKFVIVIS
jgi:hypothetical protein